jgi:hypothetical protein
MAAASPLTYAAENRRASSWMTELSDAAVWASRRDIPLSAPITSQKNGLMSI